DTERALPDVEDFTMYLGTGEEAAKRIRVNLFAGKNHNPCEYDEIILYQIPVASYDKSARELAAGRIKTTEFDNDTYKGTVDCKENSLLYLSIVDADGWDIYADGKKCKKIDKVNVAFTGVFLPKGAHKIEMVYHTKGFFVGLIITLAGLVIMIAILRIWKGRRGRSS
ncbi:MAG: YfhO family protein, partial [Firmicutes bacterium]|nr:YfhO family protein [Bacillota bacterium]